MTIIDRNITLENTEIRIREYLINAIHNGKSKGMSYTAVNEDLDLGLNFAIPSDRSQIGTWLGHISTFEFENDRPILSVMVMNQRELLAFGEGFYNLLEQLTGIDRNDFLNDVRRLRRLVDTCTNFWINNNNYNSHFRI
jgi:hypothetical protein